MLKTHFVDKFPMPIQAFNNKVRMRNLPKPSFPSTTTTYTNTKSIRNQIETQFISLIHSSKTITQLQQIHTQIILQNLFSNTKIITQLISSLFTPPKKFINYALSVFNSFPKPKNVFIFNAVIRGLADNCFYKGSIDYFDVMLRQNVRPNSLTFPFVLKAVGGVTEGKWLGGVVYGQICKMGVEFDTFVRVSLVDMYVKVGYLGYALQLFDESSDRNKLESVLLWNVVIKGCCKGGNLGKAVELFEAMPERNIGSWNSLINGLMRNGEVEKGMEYFGKMVEKDVVSWTTMVHGLSMNAMHDKALEVFFRMVEDEGVRPNDLTLVSVLSSSAKFGALEAGKKVHSYILNNGFRLNVAVGNALVDMYAKCGNVENAHCVFEQMKHKDILTWSIMIWGWAINGCYDQALQCFEKMKLTGMKPDEVVFLAVLIACSHAGKVDQGLQLFESMKLEYSFEPNKKHYAVIVDLYGRAGRLDDALRFIQTMPVDPDYVVWGALFCACRAHKNIEMASLASEKLLELEPKHPGSYVFLSNVYAGIGRWEDVENLRISMKSEGVEKDPGWSCVAVNGQMHRFVAGDHDHTSTKEIYSKIDELTRGARQLGYMPETDWVLHNVEEEEKEDALGSHSEKLALAFGLISTSPGVVLRIVKNLRVCGDCHSLMKYVSKMSQREIVLRDMKRFHHFRNGKCSCRDYW